LKSSIAAELQPAHTLGTVAPKPNTMKNPLIAVLLALNVAFIGR
jgi:hypothetical protein